MSDKRFYILDARTVVGNCAMFWRPSGNGYTCNLEDAGLYTEQEARSHRETDVAVPEEMARGLAVTHVRSDALWDLLRAAKLVPYGRIG